jgi:cell division transport system permease protein
MLDRIEFLSSEAASALRRNGLMTFAAISTAAVALFLLGGLSYLYYRVHVFAESIPGKFEMRVHLKDGVGGSTVSDVANRIRSLEGVQAAFWIPRDKAWALEREQNPELTEGLDNPYPEAFKVVLSDLKLSDQVADTVKAMPEVNPDEVVYLQEEQRIVERALSVVRTIGLSVGGLLFFTAGILIYNAIRLTVVSRRLEIRVMQLVGATKSTVRIPFLVEGIVQGAVGGSLAGLMILGAQAAVNMFIQNEFDPAYMPPPFPLVEVLGLLVLIGSGYGLLCSSIAVRAPLRFR